jgi:hypothetical protein
VPAGGERPFVMLDQYDRFQRGRIWGTGSEKYLFLGETGKMACPVANSRVERGILPCWSGMLVRCGLKFWVLILFVFGNQAHEPPTPAQMRHICNHSYFHSQEETPVPRSLIHLIHCSFLCVSFRRIVSNRKVSNLNGLWNRLGWHE